MTQDQDRKMEVLKFTDQLRAAGVTTVTVSYYGDGDEGRAEPAQFQDAAHNPIDDSSLQASLDICKLGDLLEGFAPEGYAPRYRAQWLGKISEAGVRRRAEFYYQQLDELSALRQQVRREMLAESAKHQASKLLCQIPSIGPIRAALLIAILQTPHRFRTKRQLWAYGGLAIETHSSADHRYVEGQLQPAKRQVSLRGLNRNHNHELKNIFKGAAIIAATKAVPFQEFYAALVAKGIRPEMARLTLARKIAAIALLVWKKGVSFDAQHLKSQTA